MGPISDWAGHIAFRVRFLPVSAHTITALRQVLINMAWTIEFSPDSVDIFEHTVRVTDVRARRDGETNVYCVCTPAPAIMLDGSIIGIVVDKIKQVAMTEPVNAVLREYPNSIYSAANAVAPTYVIDW
jgi:hypothetical protein